MTHKTRILSLATFAIVVLSATAAGATTTTTVKVAHPPTAVPTVTCQKITIDPQPTWGVVFDGTIGTHHVHLAAHHIGSTHFSDADITSLTTATGPISWTLTPVWTIPPNPYGVTSGNGPTTSGTLTCHKPPVTTTSTVPVMPPTHHVYPPVPKTTTSIRIGTAITAHKELPMTGSSSGPLALFGASLVAGGAAMVLKGRRR